MRGKRLILLLAGFLLLLILSGLWWFGFGERDTMISPPGTVLTEERLIEDVTNIIEEPLEVLTVHSYGSYYDADVIGGPVIEKGHTLLLSVQVPFKHRNINKPVEVREAMRTHLYLSERTPPYPISGILVHSDLAFRDDRQTTTLISKRDFDGFLATLEDGPLSEEQKITKLSALWIEKYQYQSRWVDRLN